MAKKILFISHDAQRTGAPKLLINLIRLLKAETSFESIVYIRYSFIGPLLEEFKALCSTFTWTYNYRFLNRFRRKLPFWNKLPAFDLVISNTLTNGELMEELKLSGKPIYTYVHELEIAADTYTTKENLDKVIKYSDLFFVPSNAVNVFLRASLNIPQEKIKRRDYYIPSVGKDKKFPENGGEVFTIGGAGTIDWRKGADLFLVIAKDFTSKFPSAAVRFLWKGADTSSIEFKRLQYEIKKSKMSVWISYEPSNDSMDEFYNKIDVLMLTSREDPYPLVVLEAANYRIPTICFEDCGGITEFISENNAGTIVPYLSVAAMSEALDFYIKNKTSIQIHGENARNSLQQIHQNKERIINQIVSII